MEWPLAANSEIFPRDLMSSIRYGTGSLIARIEKVVNVIASATLGVHALQPANKMRIRSDYCVR